MNDQPVHATAEIDRRLDDLQRGYVTPYGEFVEDGPALVAWVFKKLFELEISLSPTGRRKPEVEAVNSEWLSIQQAADFLSVSEKHIRRAVKSGELLHSNVGGERRATYRIRRQHLSEWVESRRARKTPPKSERDAKVEKYFPTFKGRRRQKR